MSKRGRLSKVQKQYIEDNAAYVKYDEIARRIQKTPEMVKKYIEETMGLTTNLGEGAAVIGESDPVEQREFWPILQQQFTQAELQIFIYHWNKICEQFHHDILPTEEIQIIDTIKLEILMQRNMLQQKLAMDSITTFDREIDDAKDANNIGDIIQLEKDASFARQNFGTLTREYRELQDKKNKMFEALKATRASRQINLDKSRKTFTHYLEELINNPELRDEIGHRAEKMRLAAIDEQVRLSAYHKYEDGMVDQPMLNEATVK